MRKNSDWLASQLALIVLSLNLAWADDVSKTIPPQSEQCFGEQKKFEELFSDCPGVAKGSPLISAFESADRANAVAVCRTALTSGDAKTIDKALAMLVYRPDVISELIDELLNLLDSTTFALLQPQVLSVLVRGERLTEHMPFAELHSRLSAQLADENQSTRQAAFLVLLVSGDDKGIFATIRDVFRDKQRDLITGSLNWLASRGGAGAELCPVVVSYFDRIVKEIPDEGEYDLTDKRALFVNRDLQAPGSQLHAAFEYYACLGPLAEQALPQLRFLLAHEKVQLNWGLLTQAIIAVAGEERFGSIIAEDSLLRQENPQILLPTLKWISEHGEKSLPLLINVVSLMSHADKETKNQARLAAFKIASVEGVDLEPLIAAYENSSPEIGASILWTISHRRSGTLRDEQLNRIIAKASQSPQHQSVELYRLLSRLGAAVQLLSPKLGIILHAGLEAPNEDVNLAALEVLRYLDQDGKDYLDDLVSLAVGDADKVRAKALNVLSYLGNSAAPSARVLRKRFSLEENAEARAGIIQVLASIWEVEKPPLEIYLAALKDPERVVRKSGAIGLTNDIFETEKVLEPLLAALNDVDYEVRRYVILALGNHKKEAAKIVPKLNVIAQRDDNELVRNTATYILSRFGSN